MLSEEIKSLVVSSAQLAQDYPMIPYDIWGTKAHVAMLEKTGILNVQDAQALKQALQDISRTWREGKFQIDSELGAQLTLEREVVKRAGEHAGLSMHTARSRNDQIMVTEMLYWRDNAVALTEGLFPVLETLLTRAEEGIGVPMPGYTHMQPGKPTALSHWFFAVHDGISRGIEYLLSVLRIYDRCPLGSVESFGTGWPIDREYTAKLLGFSEVWEIPQDAISNRGMFQLNLMQAFSQIGLPLSKFAADTMLYSTFEYGMVDFDDSVAQRLHPITGSSVMAQKRNPDAAELLRALSPQLVALESVVSSLLQKLPTGYNRDSREVKEYIGLSFEKLSHGVRAFHRLILSLVLRQERMRDMVEENYSQTTDLADFLAQKYRVPYRKVYKVVGKAVDALMAKEAPIAALTAKDLTREAEALGVELPLSEADLKEAVSPEQALERRAHCGGTNRKVAEELAAKRRKKLGEWQGEIARWRTRIEEAKALTDS